MSAQEDVRAVGQHQDDLFAVLLDYQAHVEELFATETPGGFHDVVWATVPPEGAK